MDVNSLWKQLGRLKYLGLALEILKVVQVEQFSMTLQKNKNTNENITKQWNEIEVKKKKNLHTKWKNTKVVIENYKCLQLTIDTIWKLLVSWKKQTIECLHIKNYNHF